MMSRCPKSVLLSFVVLLSLSTLGSLTAPSVLAADSAAELETAAALVPDDAAFFSTNLRLREQYEIVTGSNAWKQLTGMPVVQMGLALYKLQAANPQSPPGQVQRFFNDPDRARLRQVSVEMVSDEVFVYGDATFVETMELMQRIASVMRFGPMMAEVSGQTEFSEDQVQGMLLLNILSNNLDLIEVPNMVLGFRVKSAEAAQAELEQLEALIEKGLEECPAELEFGRKTVAGHEYLVLRGCAKDLPWDEFPMDEVEEIQTEPGQAQKVVDAVKKLEVVAALGVRENYVLLSIGPSTDVLERLGGGSDRLIDRKEFKPLNKYADRRITSLAYLSGPMSATTNDATRQVRDAVDALEQILPTTDLPKKDQKQILADARELGADLESQMPKPGPIMGLSFLTDRGVEQVSYTWTDWPQLDATQPLSLLRHIGGDPMIAIVARGRNNPEQYEILTKWIAKGIEYFEQYGLPEMDQDDREKAARMLKIGVPMLGKLDQINREKLLPALADGQTALLVDRELESTQFHTDMPETDEPMPMIEPAMVFGVSDAKLLRQGIKGYVGVVRETLEELRAEELIDLPEEFKLPEPKVTKIDGGTLYSYPLPKEVGLDEQIVPNAGLNENVAVISMSRGHTERLLADTAPTVGGVLEDLSRRRAMAQVIHIEGMVTAVKPWILWGVGQATEGQDEGQAMMIATQVTDFLDVLTVFKTITSETYREQDAIVTRMMIELEDVER